MEVRAVAKYVRVQPRKVRIVADEVRGKSAAHTAALLRYHPSKSARALRKVLVSAMANAQENLGLSPDQLRIAAITVDAGPRIKRIQARAMGRAFRIEKKTSHITVVVEEYEGEVKVKPHGTKAKPRPSFAGLAKAAGKKKKAEAAVPAEEVTAESATPEETVDTAEVAAEEASAPAEEPSVEVTAEAPAEESPAEEAAAEEAPAEDAAPEDAPAETPASETEDAKDDEKGGA